MHDTRAIDTRAQQPGIVTQLLVAVGLALCAFDDLQPGVAAGGKMLASPGWIPLVLALGLQRRQVQALPPWIRRAGLVLIGYVAVLTIITLFALPSSTAGLDVAGKATRLFLTWLTWGCVLTAGAVFIRLCPRSVVAGAIAATCLMLVFSIPDVVAVPSLGSTSFLHATLNFQERVRGPRLEASSLGAGLLVVLGIATVRLKRRTGTLLTACGSVALLLFTSSRGTLVAAGLSVAVGLVSLAVPKRGARPGTSLPSSLAATVLGAGVVTASLSLSALVTSPLWSGLSAAVSDATRSVWGLTVAHAAIQYPFGMGFAGYLVWTPALLNQAAQGLVYSFPLSDFREVFELAASGSDNALYPKTLPGMLGLHAGLLGLAAAAALYAIIIAAIWRSLRQGRGAAAMAYFNLAIVSAFYFSSPFSWEQPFLFGMLIFLEFSPRPESLERRDSSVEDSRHAAAA